MGLSEIQNLDACIQGWEIEELYTVKGGAQAAWWVTALELEHLNCQGVSVTGGSADLRKAFDEIQRELLYELLRKGGFPERVLKTYIKFQETLLVHNAVRQGLGLPYHRPCSIPQGCPLSIVFMAYMMRPWVLMMKDMGAELRVLADDIMVSVAGADSYDRFIPVI